MDELKTNIEERQGCGQFRVPLHWGRKSDEIIVDALNKTAADTSAKDGERRFF